MWDKFEARWKARGMNQGEFEASLGLAKHRISKWKAKTENFSILDAAWLARELGLSLDYLVDNSRDIEPQGITADENDVLKAFRNSGLKADEVIVALTLLSGKKLVDRRPKVDDY